MSDFKIWACYSIYNSNDYIRASLETILPYVDKVLIFDGKYATYPGPANHSTDGTIFTIHQLWDHEYGKKIEFMHAPREGYKNQVEKRNAYMEWIPIGDWVFVIDGDELMFGNNRRFRDEVASIDEEGHSIIRFRQENTDGATRLRAKMFKMEEGLRYRHYHFNINTPDDHRSRKSILAIDAPVIQCTRFIHLSTDLRGAKVEQDKETFQEMRMAIETPEWIFDQQIEYYRKLVEEHDRMKNGERDIPAGSLVGIGPETNRIGSVIGVPLDDLESSMKEYYSDKLQGIDHNE